ncbi:MAG: NAD(P)-binding protein [Solirubrobacterales bacterium]|nr:NAD(P)-binding protein [Solirubrobacterales bacterium]
MGQPRGAQEPVKVAVLGGGIGAMAAAFELTAPELDERYEVTVYQPGWRLGGKCASGRGEPSTRIEEHGLHLWFGFYANAFSMIQRCYAEWNPPQDYRLRTWDEAFKKCNDIVLFERRRREWIPWPLSLAPDEQDPGSRAEVPPWGVLHRLIDFVLTEAGLVHRASGGPAPASGPTPAQLNYGVDRLAYEAFKAGLWAARATAGARARSPARHTRPATWEVMPVQRLLSGFRDWFFRHVFDDDRGHPRVRRFALMLDLAATVLTGMLADRVLWDGFGGLNDEDLKAWLRRHGADRATIESPVIRALYDLVFAYREGDKGRPDLAAGKALQALIRIFCEYKGAVLWKMQAGMGDTVFTPLYDVLKARGVRFRFFHQVTNLGVSDDGRSVDTIEVQPQVRLVDASYDPIIKVGGLRCWPSEPKWKLIENGEKLGTRRVNFEQQCNPLGLPSITLEAGKHFDEVVLGISVGALHDICGELATAHEPFKAMLDNSYTVMTEGIQLWLAKTASQLGWPYESSVTTSYVTEADTQANMSQLLACEAWPGGDCPEEVVYLCGVLNHDGISTQEEADARVRDNGLHFLRRATCRVWPNAEDGNGGFDWDTLFDPSGAQGVSRFDAQFVRANFTGTERYVMTRANTVQYRLRADESGFANLKLAGDWTRNGLDGGSVEAAVTSGMQAARAISGSPSEIAGEKGWLVDD